jgi:hypothetical protein
MKNFYTVCGLLLTFCSTVQTSIKPTATIKDVNQHISESNINPEIPSKVQMNLQKKLFDQPNVSVNMHHIAAVSLQLPFHPETRKKAPEFVGGHHQKTLRNLIASGLATPISETTHDNDCVDFVLKNNFTGEQFLKTTFPISFDSEKILDTIKSSTLTGHRKLSDTIIEFTAKAKDEDIIMMGLLKKNKGSSEVLTTYPISAKKQSQAQNLTSKLKSK